jgi:DNA-directed RNA polymerase subunit F
MKEISQKPLALIEALAVLKRRQKDSELSYEQQAALDYVEKFAKLDLKKITALKRELTKLGVSDEGAVSLINLLPKKADEVKVVLGRGGSVVVQEDLVKGVLEALKSYRP